MKTTTDRNGLYERLKNVTDKNVEAIIKVNTEVRMRKTGNPYHGTRKHSTCHVKFNASYKAEVNAARLAEGKEADFEPTDRKWGTRVGETPLFENKGRDYVHCLIVDTIEHHYVAPNGDAVEFDQFRQFVPEQRDPASQQLEEPVIVRSYNVDNVEQVTLLDEEGNEAEVIVVE